MASSSQTLQILPQTSLKISSDRSWQYLTLLCQFMSKFTLCCYDKHHDNEQIREKLVDFILQFTVHYEGESRQELQAETWSQELKNRGGMLLTNLLPLVYTTQDHVSRDGTLHSGMGPPTSSIKTVS